MKMKHAPEWGIVIIAILWGGSYVVGKTAYQDVGPFALSMIRFVLAGLSMLVIFHRRLREIDRGTLFAGCAAGSFLGIAYIMQYVGLTYTTASKSGFITGLFVVFVPMLDAIYCRRLPARHELFGVFLATLGLACFSFTWPISFNFGDLLTLISAALFATSIVMITYFSRQHDPFLIAVVQLVLIGIISTIACLIMEPLPSLSVFKPHFIMIIIYLVYFSTVINTIVQNWAQSKVDATTAAVLFILEPVFSGIFGFLFMKDPFGVSETTGALLIVGGILFTILGDRVLARLGLARKEHNRGDL